MKALTLWQPWASLVAVGAKRFETRSWATNYRGQIAIHAAKTWNRELEDVAGNPIFQGRLKELWNNLPLGCVVAVARLSDCRPTTEIPFADVADEYGFGDYSAGRFAWILKDVQPLEMPIPAKGKQGLWEWSGGGEERVR